LWASPQSGKADGTSAIIRDHGYVFLFNPNYMEVVANFRLDPSIGLTEGDHFLLREIYPREGMLIGKEGAGAWTFGDAVFMTLEGTNAHVLEVVPLQLPVKTSLVFGSAASNSAAISDAGALRLQNIVGEPGREQGIGVLLPDAMPVKTMSLNGNDVTFSQSGNYAWSQVKFAGQKFGPAEQIKLQRKDDGIFTGAFVIPKRICTQLMQRRERWPIPWTKDDYRATWLAPERLLLYLQIAEPEDSLKPQITIDGRSATFMKAYSSIRVHPASFVGFYLDLSQIQPDAEHKIVLSVPGLENGQFQGLFFDNVEAEYTDAIGH